MLTPSEKSPHFLVQRLVFRFSVENRFFFCKIKYASGLAFCRRNGVVAI